jgi:ABC-2 type transport system ATP-binding protein
VLELRGLTRRYGDLVALDDLSLTLAEGQMFGFVGPNAAGKTTAMRIVLGCWSPMPARSAGADGVDAR